MIVKPKVYSGEQPYIFISYSHTDSEMVIEILNNMQQEKYRFWYDEGIPLMNDYIETIVDRINNCEIFMIFLTKSSMESIYVQQEIYRAFVAGKKILGILLEQAEISPGFQLILGVTQYIDKTQFQITQLFYDKLYKSEIIAKTKETWDEQIFFSYNSEKEAEKKKLSSMKYTGLKKSDPCFNAYYQIDIPMYQNRIGCKTH